MEDLISSFAAELSQPEYDGTESGSGCGYGSGCGSDDGSGYGSGGYGYGSGCGYRDGDGFGYGKGSGCGDDGSGCDDDGSGRGYGRGDSYGYGGYIFIDGEGGDGEYGDGKGSLQYVKVYCGKPVYDVDGVPTMIESVRHGVAFGATLRDDLTTTPCVIVKNGHVYAHGATLREAMAALQAKLCDGMTEKERIAAFWKCHNRTDKYSGQDLYHWHHALTGSCEFGRNEFAKSHGIDIDNSEFTVAEFVELCKNSYGGDVIRKLVK